MVFVRGYHKNVAGSSTKCCHFGLDCSQAQGLEDFDEVRDEVGAVFAAQRGLEYEPAGAVVAASTAVAAYGDDCDLVGLGRNGFKFFCELRCLLLELFHPLDHLG